MIRLENRFDDILPRAIAINFEDELYAVPALWLDINEINHWFPEPIVAIVIDQLIWSLTPPEFIKTVCNDYRDVSPENLAYKTAYEQIVNLGYKDVPGANMSIIVETILNENEVILCKKCFAKTAVIAATPCYNYWEIYSKAELNNLTHFDPLVYTMSHLYSPGVFNFDLIANHCILKHQRQLHDELNVDLTIYPRFGPPFRPFVDHKPILAGSVFISSYKLFTTASGFSPVNKCLCRVLK
jgi:hypothetical protein